MSLLESLSELRNTNSAVNVIDITKKNKKVEMKKSKIVPGQYGLFATRDIKANENVVIYFGDILTKDEFLAKYDANNKIMRYIKKGNDFWVDGVYAYRTKNRNLYGAFVNDVAQPKNRKRKAINKYIKTMKRCNLVSVDTDDFPVYVASRDIKKGEELTVHYGLGYWLLHMGVTTKELKKNYSKLIKKIYG